MGFFGENPSIKLEVYIYRRPNLRDDSLEFERYVGQNVLRGLFDEMKMMPEVKDLYLPFPETWLNIIEQRVLYQRLEYYCPNLERVRIKTHSVYIIQCTPNGSAKIIGSEEEFNNPLPGETVGGKINLTDKLYTQMTGNLFDVDKLNVF